MKLYECFSEKDFHTCISTTFGIDFHVYENIVLSRLTNSGCYNNLLLTDAGMLTCELSETSNLPSHAGSQYTVTGVNAESVFHPKIVLQIGKKKARLLISSANITTSGLAGNLELAGLIECNQDESGEKQIIASAWHYLEGFLDTGLMSIKHQTDWMYARSRWLLDLDSPPVSGALKLFDGTLAAFLGSSPSEGLGIRFVKLINEKKIERLIVISPYWDRELKALKFLADQLQPMELIILIDKNQHSFPVNAMEGLKNAKIWSLDKFAKGRFIHSKAFIVQTKEWEHVLYGSANCTTAALGSSTFAGSNKEACLYRRLPLNTIINVLGLSQLLLEPPLNPNDIQPFIENEPLPLKEALQQSPGRFEYVNNTLFWWPSTTTLQCKIELYSVSEGQLAVFDCPSGHGQDSKLSFQSSKMDETPAFARLCFANGGFSTRALVTTVELVQKAVRDVRTSSVEAVVQQLSQATEIGLWVLEMLTALQCFDLEQKNNSGSKKNSKEITPEESLNADQKYQILDYEQFIAGRKLRVHAVSHAFHSLAGSEISIFRIFLNRVLWCGGEDPQEIKSLNEAEAKHFFDLGDEFVNTEEYIESGAKLMGVSRSEEKTAARNIQHQQRVRLQQTCEQVADAVEHFIQYTQKPERELNSVDVLRFRAMLMIVASASYRETKRNKIQNTSNLLQVLSSDVEFGWPKLLGRLLFAFFSCKAPAINKLKIEAESDQIPHDIVECWMTSFWAVQICLEATLNTKKFDYVKKIAVDVYAKTGLKREEMINDKFLEMFEKLNLRFCIQLGVCGAKVLAAHMKMAKACV